MSTINFSDITLAGAYAHAMKVARESDNRNAERHLETSNGHNGRQSLRPLLRRIAATLAERRLASSALTSRPV